MHQITITDRMSLGGPESLVTSITYRKMGFWKLYYSVESEMEEWSDHKKYNIKHYKKMNAYYKWSEDNFVWFFYATIRWNYGLSKN